MARKAKSESKKTGLFHAREARRMSRSELVRRSGVSKQQLSQPPDLWDEAVAFFCTPVGKKRPMISRGVAILVGWRLQGVLE
jgi:hypothetical protein